MSKYNSNLFESIKEALGKKSSSEGGSFRDFLKLETGNTYIVRLIPNVEAPDRTLFHYYHHMWKSVVTNQTVSVLCPNTYGEGCPIDEYRSKVYSTKNQDQIDAIKPLRRNENWLVNVYVVKDPTNPENQGQVKILRIGKKLFNVISEAIGGEDAEEFGQRIFDLSDKGCNLRIKVEQNQGGYPDYAASKFLSPSALEGSPDVDEIYKSVKSLDTIFEHKTRDEISKTLKVHFLGETEEVKKQEAAPFKQVEEDEDDIDYSTSPKQTQSVASSQVEETVDQTVEDILKDL